MRANLDSGECRFLFLLGRFDAERRWADEGFKSPVPWLEQHCGLSRGAASERVRVARQLRKRSVLADAADAGVLSYSKLRALSRLDPKGIDEVDRILVSFAETHRATEVEDLVQQWKQEIDDDNQTDPANTRFDRAGVTAHTTYDGMGVIEAVTASEDHHELLAIIDANVERRWHQQTGGNVPAGTPTGQVDNRSVDPGEDVPAGTPTSQVDNQKPPWPELRRRRADALAELLRVGHAHLDHPADSSGADRYTLNLTATLADLAGHPCQQPTLSNGRAVSVDTALRVACDCAIVRHLLGGDSEILDLGRKTRVWNRAQRRAIRRRDNNRCRYPGCNNRIHDIHHIHHWTQGGTTDIDNGCLLCPAHHKLAHEGHWTITGHPNRTLTFHSPTGLQLHSPRPHPIPRRPAA